MTQNAVLFCDSEFKLVDRVVQDLAHVRESTNLKSRRELFRIGGIFCLLKKLFCRYGEEAEIKVRLNFLEHIFSNISTSKNFGRFRFFAQLR